MSLPSARGSRIVSGAAREEIEPVVAAAGLGELFATVVAADDVVRGKPDPESYLLALRALGTARRETLAFEDTEAGVASAKAAGTRASACSARTRPSGSRRRTSWSTRSTSPLLRRLLG